MRVRRQQRAHLVRQHIAHLLLQTGDLEDLRRGPRGQPDAADDAHARHRRHKINAAKGHVDKHRVQCDLDLVFELDALRRLRVDDHEGAPSQGVRDDEHVVYERPRQRDVAAVKGVQEAERCVDAPLTG